MSSEDRRGRDPGLGEEALGARAASIAPGPDSLLRFADAVSRLGAEDRAAPPEEELHLLTFYLDREEFGIPITRAREILRVEAISRVPGAPPHIRGVTNVRGRVVPVVEIRTRIMLPPAEITPRSRVLLVDAHDRVLGLLVDATARIFKAKVSAIQSPPEEVVTRSTDYVRAVVRADPGLVFLIDLDRTLLLHASPE